MAVLGIKGLARSDLSRLRDRARRPAFRRARRPAFRKGKLMSDCLKCSCHRRRNIDQLPSDTTSPPGNFAVYKYTLMFDCLKYSCRTPGNITFQQSAQEVLTPARACSSSLEEYCLPQGQARPSLLEELRAAGSEKRITSQQRPAHPAKKCHLQKGHAHD